MRWSTLDRLRPASQQLLVQTSKPVTNQTDVVQRIVNGTVERYIAPNALAAVINGPQITQAPEFVRAWTSFQRQVTTVLSPAFALVRNPSLDIPEYMTRELARSGGNPLVIPHLVSELARGYVDAFQGLLRNEYAGRGAQEFLLGGGGQSGMVERTVATRRDAVEALARGSGMVVNGLDDVGRIVKDLVTLKPVGAVAERTELGPRIASMRLAQQRGANQVQAVLNGRTVTMDFAEGGTAAKTINQFIPFFNAGVQGSAQVVRMYRENPGGALAATVMLAGLPSVMAEAWNNSDAQRARDYVDVPDYLKQQGVVVMLPGEAPTDDRGNRRPQFWWINMRGLAPFSTLARQAVARVLEASGNRNVQPEDWAGLVRDVVMANMPMRANQLSDVPGSVTGPGLVPGAGVGLQLALNKDIFRNADIATPRRDEYASAAGKVAATAITAVARAIDPSAQFHPSQVDFAVRELLGGVGAAALGASDIAAGNRRDTAVQSAPVAGGLARAVGIRGDTGQGLQEARSHTLTPEAQRVLNTAGLQAPQPVLGTIHYSGYAIPLHQDEQAMYQQLFTDHTSALINQYAPALTGAYDQVQRQEVLDKVTAAARRRAELEVLETIADSDVERRIVQEDQRRRVGRQTDVPGTTIIPAPTPIVPTPTAAVLPPPAPIRIDVPGAGTIRLSAEERNTFARAARAYVDRADPAASPEVIRSAARRAAEQAVIRSLDPADLQRRALPETAASR
jgi:hypothetical protein